MIKLTKHTIRLSYYLISLFLIIIFYYVLYGHKQYSILEKYQETIVYNIKSQYGIDVSYQELHEDWHYFKPNFDIKNLIIKDKNGNELKAENVEVRLDLLYSLLNKKIKFKNISIENSNLKYSYLKADLNNKETVSIPDISNFNINKLKIINLNIDLTYNEKNYKLDNVNLKYNSSDDHATLNYNKIDFKYYFNKNNFHTFDLNFAVSDLIKTATDLNLLENLKSIGYNSFFSLNGNLNIKVNYVSQEDFDVKVNLIDSELKLLKAGLQFDKINGLLFFNKKENILTSNKINCLIKNKKCSFEIKNENGNQYLSFESLVGKEIIGKYVPFFDINNFSGETKITGVFDFNKQTLNIDSNLKGLSINNMPLISKVENEELSLSVFTNFIKEYYVKVRLEDIQVFVDFNRNYNTQVYLNQPDIAFSPIKENFYLKGELDNLDVSNTLNFVNNLKFENNNNNKSNYKVELDLNYPNYIGINPERVIYRDNNGLATINIMDDYFNGNIIYNILENKMKIEMDKFYYQTLNGIENNNKVSIKNFPNIEGVIKDLNINGYKGNLAFNGYHSNNFYIIDNIKGELNKIIPNFIIKFSEESEKITTELISVNNNKLIEFNNVADILDSYNYVDTLNSEKGQVYGKISWEGIKPNMKTLNGDISFNIENGKLNLSSTGNRVLKIFKIFEINMLKEIFKLDFDFMKKGLKYEKLSGKGNFVDGIYFIEDKIEMKSDNYNAGLSGKIDFYNEKFENKIKIDLPISQKLPTIAILTGNPAAVAGVWIADKLIGDKLNSLSSIKFTINGTFEKPNISK